MANHTNGHSGCRCDEVGDLEGSFGDDLAGASKGHRRNVKRNSYDGFVSPSLQDGERVSSRRNHIVTSRSCRNSFLLDRKAEGAKIPFQDSWALPKPFASPKNDETVLLLSQLQPCVAPLSESSDLSSRPVLRRSPSETPIAPFQSQESDAVSEDKGLWRRKETSKNQTLCSKRHRLELMNVGSIPATPDVTSDSSRRTIRRGDARNPADDATNPNPGLSAGGNGSFRSLPYLLLLKLIIILIVLAIGFFYLGATVSRHMAFYPGAWLASAGLMPFIPTGNTNPVLLCGAPPWRVDDEVRLVREELLRHSTMFDIGVIVPNGTISFNETQTEIATEFTTSSSTMSPLTSDLTEPGPERITSEREGKPDVFIIQERQSKPAFKWYNNELVDRIPHSSVWLNSPDEDALKNLTICSRSASSTLSAFAETPGPLKEFPVANAPIEQREIAIADDTANTLLQASNTTLARLFSPGPSLPVPVSPPASPVASSSFMSWLSRPLFYGALAIDDGGLDLSSSDTGGLEITSNISRPQYNVPEDLIEEGFPDIHRKTEDSVSSLAAGRGLAGDISGFSTIAEEVSSSEFRSDKSAPKISNSGVGRPVTAVPFPPWAIVEQWRKHRIFPHRGCSDFSWGLSHALYLELADLLVSFLTAAASINAQYFLDGYSLTGSLRHYDVVPWDDEINFRMHINDTVKLLDLIQSSSFAELEGLSLSNGRGKVWLRRSTTRETFRSWKYPFINLFSWEEVPEPLLEPTTRRRRSHGAEHTPKIRLGTASRRGGQGDVGIPQQNESFPSDNAAPAVGTTTTSFPLLNYFLPIVSLSTGRSLDYSSEPSLENENDLDTSRIGQKNSSESLLRAAEAHLWVFNSSSVFPTHLRPFGPVWVPVPRKPLLFIDTGEAYPAKPLSDDAMKQSPLDYSFLLDMCRSSSALRRRWLPRQVSCLSLARYLPLVTRRYSRLACLNHTVQVTERGQRPASLQSGVFGTGGSPVRAGTLANGAERFNDRAFLTDESTNHSIAFPEASPQIVLLRRTGPNLLLNRIGLREYFLAADQAPALDQSDTGEKVSSRLLDCLRMTPSLDQLVVEDRVSNYEEKLRDAQQRPALVRGLPEWWNQWDWTAWSKLLELTAGAAAPVAFVWECPPHTYDPDLDNGIIEVWSIGGVAVGIVELCDGDYRNVPKDILYR